MNIDISTEVHNLVKLYASHNHESIEEFVLKAVEERLQQQQSDIKQLNPLTTKTLRAADQGKDLSHYSSIDAMYNKLGI